MNTNVVAISGALQHARLLDALLHDDSSYDSVVMETIAGGYGRIRREQPDLVIVYLAIDDAATCQLLSMLALDPETSRIPVVTWTERFDAGVLDCLIADAMKDPSALSAAIPAN